MEHLGRHMRVGVSECIWGFSAGLSYSHTGGVIIPWRIVDFQSGMSVGLDWTFVDGDIYLARLCVLERPGLRDTRVRNDDNVNVIECQCE